MIDGSFRSGLKVHITRNLGCHRFTLLKLIISSFSFFLQLMWMCGC